MISYTLYYKISNNYNQEECIDVNLIPLTI